MANEETDTQVYEPGFNPTDTVDHERIRKEKIVREAIMGKQSPNIATRIMVDGDKEYKLITLPLNRKDKTYEIRKNVPIILQIQ